MGVRERKKRATREAMHRAAVELVAEHGASAVTTGMIAEAAGVSPRTFFNYWDSKEAAVLGLVGEPMETAAVQMMRERPLEEPPRETLRAVVVALTDQLPTEPALRMAKKRAMEREPELQQMSGRFMAAMQTAMTEALAERIERARSQGIVDESAPGGEAAIPAHDLALLHVQLAFATARSAFALSITHGTTVTAQLEAVHRMLDEGAIRP